MLRQHGVKIGLNLVLFVADDQSVFDYGAYGNIAVPTSATDQFAKESLVFDCAFTGGRRFVRRADQ